MISFIISDDTEQSKRQLIVDSILTDIEKFRTEATKAFAEFSPLDRVLVENLKTDRIDAYNVLSSWGENLKPLLIILDNKLSDATFRNSMTEHLILEEDEIQGNISKTIKERETEIMNNFISKFYPIEKNKKDIYCNQREQAEALLTRPLSEIEQIHYRYINYLLHKEIADKNGVTIVDSHTPLFKRILSKKNVNRERKKIMISDNNRLLYINDRIKSLTAINGGLLVDIFNRKWDLIVVLDLRNTYEKKISKLSKQDTKNAVKLLAIFDAVTSDFKKCQIDKMIVNSDQSNLETTRTITKDVDNLLLRIFDLSNIQKNQLLVCTKEYRELSQEKMAILDKHSN